ncbi:MAG: LysM peptidoglycan-binding domain-containing protein [Phycisphaerae bacterium]|nr:LysM peptidoglycan-binding domain-containing protein [Phycisphaerae bacterium]
MCNLFDVVVVKMQKDLKIGLILGLAVVSVAVLWLATRPSLSPQARMPDARGTDIGPGSAAHLGATHDTVEAVDSRKREALNTPAPRVPIRRTRTGERVERDTAAKPAIYVQPERIRPQRFHVVRDGETLSKISYDYYGSAGKWRRIFEANRKTIKDANVVVPGTKLIIPN